jgi:hypothetical protein
VLCEERRYFLTALRPYATFVLNFFQGPLVALKVGNMVLPIAVDSGRQRTDLAQRLEDRLATLKGEYDKGEARVHQLETELTSLRETMLRISGAILVLQEILSAPVPTTSAPLDDATTVARTDSLASTESDQLAVIR